MEGHILADRRGLGYREYFANPSIAARGYRGPIGKKRILFVDDDPNVLRGLERMLRPLRHECQMTFVGNGVDALARLEQESVDVIVCDLRMPGMDGIQLLNEVMQKFPRVVRILLSGQVGKEAVLKATGSSHAYLSKPCEPEVLKAAVMQLPGEHELVMELSA